MEVREKGIQVNGEIDASFPKETYFRNLLKRFQLAKIGGLQP